MVNPRQRSKRRSGSYKPVHHAKHAKKMLKKQPPIRGPKVLQDAWDKHKTVQQNYAALGLVSSLNPTASGGTERELYLYPPSQSTSSITEPPQPSKIPRGYGKIIRDEDGNVIDIEFAEEDEEETTMDRDDEIDMDRAPLDASLINWVKLGSSTHGVPPAKDSSVVHELERISEAAPSRGARPASGGEKTYLQRLVAKHRDDLEAMAKDRRLNPEQKTAGQLGRAIRTAGL